MAARNSMPLPYPHHPNANAALARLPLEQQSHIINITWGNAQPVSKYGGKGGSSSSSSIEGMQQVAMQYWQAGVVSTVSNLLREHMQPIVIESDAEPDPPAAPAPDPAAAPAPDPAPPADPPRHRIRGKQASAHARDVTHSMKSH